MIRWIRAFLLTAPLVSGCGSTSTEVTTQADDTMTKIELDLNSLDERGLQGPPDGLRSMAYEFCIPANEVSVREVIGIDPTIRVQRQSPGRIGCSEDQYLCIGETHQPDHKAVLQALASLPYVQRIIPAYFE